MLTAATGEEPAAAAEVRAERSVIRMGEIIFSLCVGGVLVIAGILMNITLKKEENKLRHDRDTLSED